MDEGQLIIFTHFKRVIKIQFKKNELKDQQRVKTNYLTYSSFLKIIQAVEKELKSEREFFLYPLL